MLKTISIRQPHYTNCIKDTLVNGSDNQDLFEPLSSGEKFGTTVALLVERAHKCRLENMMKSRRYVETTILS